MGLLDQGVLLGLILGDPPYSFLYRLHHFTFPPMMHERSLFATSLPTLGIFRLSRNFFCFCFCFCFCFVPYKSLPNAYEVLPHCGFHVHYPNGWWCRAPFMHMLAVYESSLETRLFVLCPFSIRVVCFSFLLLLRCKSSLSVLDVKPLSDDMICKYFLSLWSVL